MLLRDCGGLIESLSFWSKKLNHNSPSKSYKTSQLIETKQRRGSFFLTDFKKQRQKTKAEKKKRDEMREETIKPNDIQHFHTCGFFVQMFSSTWQDMIRLNIRFNRSLQFNRDDNGLLFLCQEVVTLTLFFSFHHTPQLSLRMSKPPVLMAGRWAGPVSLCHGGHRSPPSLSLRSATGCSKAPLGRIITAPRTSCRECWELRRRAPTSPHLLPVPLQTTWDPLGELHHGWPACTCLRLASRSLCKQEWDFGNMLIRFLGVTRLYVSDDSPRYNTKLSFIHGINKQV